MPEVVSFENLNLFRWPQPTHRNVLQGCFTDGESISSNVADGLETIISRQIILANVVFRTVKVITKRTCGIRIITYPLSKGFMLILNLEESLTPR
nr:hypothetical protein Itr_chr14CG14560 [Ipomoea trifida]